MPTASPALRPRSTAALVFTRPDPPQTPPPRAPTAAPDDARWPRWLDSLAWAVLGLCVAAAWAALLLGDSLSG